MLIYPRILRCPFCSEEIPTHRVGLLSGKVSEAYLLILDEALHSLTSAIAPGTIDRTSGVALHIEQVLNSALHPRRTEQERGVCLHQPLDVGAVWIMSGAEFG